MSIDGLLHIAESLMYTRTRGRMSELDNDVVSEQIVDHLSLFRRRNQINCARAYLREQFKSCDSPWMYLGTYLGTRAV